MLTKDQRKVYQKVYRERQKGLQNPVGLQNSKAEGLQDSQGLQPKGLQGLQSNKHLIETLLDPIKREKLQAICRAFETSHHPEFANEVWMGNVSLGILSLILERT